MSNVNLNNSQIHKLELSELNSLKGRAFGQFSSCETQRPDTTDPIEIKLTDQEDMFGGEHTIDFVQGLSSYYQYMKITFNNSEVLRLQGGIAFLYRVKRQSTRNKI